MSNFTAQNLKVFQDTIRNNLEDEEIIGECSWILANFFDQEYFRIKFHHDFIDDIILLLNQKSSK